MGTGIARPPRSPTLLPPTAAGTPRPPCPRHRRPPFRSLGEFRLPFIESSSSSSTSSSTYSAGRLLLTFFKRHHEGLLVVLARQQDADVLSGPSSRRSEAHPCNPHVRKPHCRVSLSRPYGVVPNGAMPGLSSTRPVPRPIHAVGAHHHWQHPSTVHWFAVCRFQAPHPQHPSPTPDTHLVHATTGSTLTLRSNPETAIMQQE